MKSEHLLRTGKVWIYQSDRELSSEEQKEIEAGLKEFCRTWTAHNLELSADYKVLYNRFIVLEVDESAHDASGCSIDKSVAFLKTLGARYEINLFDRMHLAYLENDTVKTVHLNEIAEAYKNGIINDSSMFFNTNISRLEDFDSGFLLPLAEHWLKSRI